MNRQLKLENARKHEELEQIKRDMRATRQRETEAEAVVYQNECVRLRAVISDCLQQITQLESQPIEVIVDERHTQLENQLAQHD